MARVAAGRIRDRTTAGRQYRGRDRRRYHVAAHAVHRGENHQPQARTEGPGTTGESATSAGKETEGIEEPRQSTGEGGPHPRPDDVLGGRRRLARWGGLDVVALDDGRVCQRGADGDVARTALQLEDGRRVQWPGLADGAGRRTRRVIRGTANRRCAVGS